jgi:Nucleotidyl transferase AbiEii toxin, Type IV TA system
LPPSEVLKDVQVLGLPVHVRQNDEGTFLGHVGGVDYSVFRYRYPPVRRPVTVEVCELASLRDIAAIKMTAIVQRATKRDYVDLDALFKSRRVSLGDAISTMNKKFPGVDLSLALRALTYFRDVEQQPMPAMLVNTTWEDVKRGLIGIRDRGLDRDGPSRWGITSPDLAAFQNSERIVMRGYPFCQGERGEMRICRTPRSSTRASNSVPKIASRSRPCPRDGCGGRSSRSAMLTASFLIDRPAAGLPLVR